MKSLWWIILVCIVLSPAKAAEFKVSDLPEMEKELANTVDPWGLSFSDQLSRFKSYFDDATNAQFAVGFSHGLVKIWPNKYWFRGEGVIASGRHKATRALWATTGSTISFQLAILPKIAAEKGAYKVAVEAPVKTRIYREEFIKLGPAAYPRFESEFWPDPLVPADECELAGIRAGVFLIEAFIPADFSLSRFDCKVRVTLTGGEKAEFIVPVETVKLALKPPDFHLVAWFKKGKMGDQQFDDLCALALEHHLEPLIQGELTALWSTNSSAKFEKQVEYLTNKGQRIFQINKPDQTLYDFLVKKGWLDRFIIYSNADEPAADTFKTSNIPFAEEIRKKFPGLKIYLASEYHADMDKGCDIWLTDISSSQYDPRTFVPPDKPDMWHYYCHLPINWQMRAPLTRAPNMQIDNTALEHRLAIWMSWHYKAKGVFIFAGNSDWKSLGTNFWSALDLSGGAYRNEYKYPYGGVHYGNGNLVYPPQSPAGEALPSLRLKVLRDGMQDIAVFENALQQYGEKIRADIAFVPGVFQHPQYYDHLPETLLKKREELLKKIRTLQGEQ